MTEASYTEKGIIAWYLPYGNYGPTRLPERFVDSLLAGVYGGERARGIEPLEL
jgi:hypothetical protein